jgi:DNA helicase HerA-like ATPase
MARIEALRADKRLDFMFSGHMVRDNMAEIISQLLRIPVRGKPITILDISGLPAEIVDVVVSVLCRMIFDFAMWSDRADGQPVLLVCEEAHRYAPQDEALGFGPTKLAISRIAKEGRKYGVSLCLVSQRPSELSTSILSQCNTLFALRMSNERDHVYVRNALPDSAHGLIAALPSLRTQEAIAVGEGVTVPMRLRFDDLDERFRPMSGTANFSSAWQNDEQDEEFIEKVVDRWRRQLR